MKKILAFHGVAYTVCQNIKFISAQTENLIKFLINLISVKSEYPPLWANPNIKFLLLEYLALELNYFLVSKKKKVTFKNISK